MDDKHDNPAGLDLAQYTSVGDWLDRYAGPFFETRSSLDWFIRRNWRELVEDGALLPREGRAGSLVSIEDFPKSIVRIVRRRALERAGAELEGVGVEALDARKTYSEEH